MKRRTNKIRTVVIAGPPAGGKGTLCDCIKSELDLVHISTGALLRDAAKTDRHLAARMATGALVDTEMVFGFLEKRMGMKDAMTRGVLLDGFPRNKRQAAMLRASGRSVDIFMLLNVNDSICEGRVLGRAATAKKQGRPAREDDTSEVIRNRLKIYHATIAEFASCYDRCTIAIDGNGSRGHVQELARDALADPAAAMKSLKRKLKEDAVDAVHKHVRSKPSRDSLVKKGILQEHAFVVKLDPSLAAPAKKLQKSFKCDVLSQNLRNRPTKKELHKRNILHEDHHADKIGRTLVQASKKLEKSLKKVLLKQKLENRPTVKQLKAKNIIHESHGEVANAIAGTTKILETAIKKDALSQTLRKRQSLNAIHDAGIADKFHPHFKGHPDVTSAPLTNGIDKSKDGDQNLKQCLAEVRRALKNLRELRGWLDKIPV